jgi:hypothetical protein
MFRLQSRNNRLDATTRIFVIDPRIASTEANTTVNCTIWLNLC